MKILAYTSPARGHLFPLVPILDELSSRGHKVAVRTLASEVPMLRERGFDRVTNLRGGILEWIARLDDSMPTY